VIRLLLALAVMQPTPPVCGSTDGAALALARERVKLASGRSLSTLHADVGDSLALPEYWGSRPYKDIPWLLVGANGRRRLIQVYSCDFDEADRIRRCAPFDEPQVIQLVSFEKWENTPDGTSIAVVLQELCEPQHDDTTANGERRLEYTVEMPEGNLHGTCVGSLYVVASQVLSKELVCR